MVIGEDMARVLEYIAKNRGKNLDFYKGMPFTKFVKKFLPGKTVDKLFMILEKSHLEGRKIFPLVGII